MSVGVEILDEALSSLPDPPRRMRTIALATMIATVLVAGGLAWSLRGEAAYAWRHEEVVDLGAVEETTPLDDYAGRYVRARVTLEPEGATEFRRLLERDRYRLAFVKDYAHPKLWVQYRVPAELDGPRFLPPHLVAGRLVRTTELGPSHRGLASQLGPGFLLIDGEDPSSTRWAIGLMALLAAIVLWNAYSIARVLRPRKV